MQRRIYATIARFKGPQHDGSSLIDAKILTRRYISLYPAEAEKAGLDDGLLTRLDESSGQEMMETANWYLKRGDDVAARMVLQRLVRDHHRVPQPREGTGDHPKQGLAHPAQRHRQSPNRPRQTLSPASPAPRSGRQCSRRC